MTSRSGSGTASGSGTMGRDLVWKHCTLLEGNKNGTICNYYGLLIKSGGITRFKFHLSNTNPHSNTKKFHRVSPKVKEEIWELLHKKTKAKTKKVGYIKDIHAELSGTMGDN